MKKIFLTFGFVLLSLMTGFSQKGSLHQLNNDKIINYILAGKYQKVIELTKLPSFDQVMLLDTNWTQCKFYSRSNGHLDSVFIKHMIRINNIINSKNIIKEFEDPKNLQIEISNHSFADFYLEGTTLPITKYYSRCYKITDFKYTYSLIISFIDLKLNGISIFIQKNIIE